MSNAIDRYGAPVLTRNTAAEARAPESTGEIPASQTADASDFFGKDGLSFRDVLDAINPLNHIPIVSELMQSATGHEVSTASKLVGGALLGGPIGVVASLINAVFEQQTGKDVAQTVLAALTDEAPSETMVADNSPAPNNPPIQVASLERAPAAEAITPRPSSHPVNAHVASLSDDMRDKALLALYGASAPSAHKSYQNAQLRAYLSDVNTSRVI